MSKPKSATALTPAGPKRRLKINNSLLSGLARLTPPIAGAIPVGPANDALVGARRNTTCKDKAAYGR